MPIATCKCSYNRTAGKCSSKVSVSALMSPAPSEEGREGAQLPAVASSRGVTSAPCEKEKESMAMAQAAASGSTPSASCRAPASIPPLPAAQPADAAGSSGAAGLLEVGATAAVQLLAAQVHELRNELQQARGEALDLREQIKALRKQAAATNNHLMTQSFALVTLQQQNIQQTRLATKNLEQSQLLSSKIEQLRSQITGHPTAAECPADEARDREPGAVPAAEQQN